MAGMTDEEAERLLPVVNEFVDAVVACDVEMVAACLQHTPSAQLAVLCAELLAAARKEGSLAVNHGLWVELARTRAKVIELRALLGRGAGRKT